MSVRFIRYARPAIAAAIAQQPGQTSARIRAEVWPGCWAMAAAIAGRA